MWSSLQRQQEVCLPMVRPFVVYDEPGEYGACNLVYARDVREAVRLALDEGDLPREIVECHINVCEPVKEDEAYTEPCVCREPRLMRLHGIRSEDETCCECCGLYPLDMPEYAVCEECGNCPECGHDEDCPLYEGDKITTDNLEGHDENTR